jgi:hypothetical protein
MDLRAGVKGVNYEVFDEYVALYTRNDSGERISQPGIAIDLGLEEYVTKKPLVKNDYIGDLDEIIAFTDFYNSIQELNSEQIADGNFYSTPLVSGGEKLVNIKSRARVLFSGMVSSIMSSNNSIEGFIENYNEKLISLGIIDMLDELNRGND